MRPILLSAAFPLIWLAATTAGSAQGFTPFGTAPTQTAPSSNGSAPAQPGMGGQAPAYPSPQPGMAGGMAPLLPPTQPGAGGQTPNYPQPQPGMAGPSPGFPSAQPQPQPGPARQNYAEELTDFGVPPKAELEENVASPTPTTIPGAHVITTAEMRQAAGSDILFVDVLAGPAHASIPGALMMPGAGDGGSFDDELQQRLWTALSQATQMNPNRPIVFFCAGSRCWESYNAALRAVQMGFKVVLWYRGGLAAWQAAGLPMTQPGGGAAPRPQQQRPGFGANPG